MKMETKDFNRSIKRFMRTTDLADEIVLKKIAFDLLSNILKPEPDGTHPTDTGQARAGWHAAVSGLGKSFNMDSRLKSTSKVSEGKRQGKYKAKLTGTKKYIEMVNAVGHIVFLEYGWSKQAPLGMVRISMRKMRGKLPKELGREYKKAWRKMRRKGIRSVKYSEGKKGIKDLLGTYTTFED